MFTGIVSDIGVVREFEKRGDLHVVIAAQSGFSDMAAGASIACAGICLTVTERGGREEPWFAVTASGETLSRTNIGKWCIGRRVNLEHPLRVGDELGGHIVTGHVDGTAKIVGIACEGESKRMTFSVPPGFAPFIAPKGSIALDGVSLTVNEVDGESFGANLIPHTLGATTFGESRQGDCVNFEVDVLARYVARLAGT
jgi:riboflavin synthase